MVEAEMPEDEFGEEVHGTILSVEGVHGQDRLILRLTDEEDPDNARFAEIGIESSGDRLTFDDLEVFLREIRHAAAVYFDEEDGLDLQGEVSEWVEEDGHEQ